MDVERINRIKRIAIIALASDDALMEALVLKGGNAIDLVYQSEGAKLSRASYDLDYSINHGDFERSVSERINAALSQTYREYGYEVFEYSFGKRPEEGTSARVAEFWGGYKVKFKVIPTEKFQAGGRVEENRRRAIILKPDTSPVFELEFSKFEYVEPRVPVNVEGYTVYVYTAEMIAFEKLRALCQQLPGYSLVVPSFKRRARARDFYDIHLILERHVIDPQTQDNVELIRNIFSAKRVPVAFINEIETSRAFHADDWKAVLDTLPRTVDVKDFNYYFDYVIDRFGFLTFP